MEHLKLAKLLSNGCVLQRGEQTTLWGWAEPGSIVSLGIAGSEGRTESEGMHAECVTVTSATGRWQTTIGPLAAGGPFTLTVSASIGAEPLKLTRECYVGDVFLCSGQSNMELPMSWVRTRFPDFFSYSDVSFRNYKVVPKPRFDNALDDHEDANWAGCAPDTIGGFSALAYFFGRALRKELAVPIGIIDVSLGGSPLESWLDREALQSFPAALDQLVGYETDGLANAKHEASLAAAQRWIDALDQERLDSLVCSGTDTFDWKGVELPGSLEEFGFPQFHGLVYFKKTIEIPGDVGEGPSALQSGTLQPNTVHLGTLLDADTTYVNGVEVGHSDYQYLQRDYEIPAGALHPGTNEIVIGLSAQFGNGRVTPGKQLSLEVGGVSYPLEGRWEFAVAATAESACPTEDFIQWKPTVLYNAMLHPCLPMTTKAVLWYQGESNATRPDDYEELLKTLVASWRTQMGNPDLAFYIVQLPGFGIDNPEDGGWAGVRNAQLRTALSVPHTDIVPSLDCGEWNDLHPMDKKTLGERVARVVLAQSYGIGSWNPPQPSTWAMTEERSLLGPHRWKVSIQFAASGAALHTLDGRVPGEFDFAWKDGSHHSVPARIDGLRVVIEEAVGRKPDFIHYAYSACPANGLLCDEQEIPVVAFRIDVATGEIFA